MPNEPLKSTPAKPIALRVIAAIELETFRAEETLGLGTPSRSEGISSPTYHRLDFLAHLNRPASTLGFIVPPSGARHFQHSIHSPFSGTAYSLNNNGLVAKSLDSHPPAAGPT